MTIVPQVKHNAKAVVVKERETGFILYESNKDALYAPASIMKLILFLACIENPNCNLNEEVVIKGMKQSKRSILKNGEKYKLSKLLEFLSCASSNETALAIANHFGGEQEILKRIEYILKDKVGIKNTRFNNVSGLEGCGVISANELAKVFEYILDNHLEKYMQYFSYKKIVFKNKEYKQDSVIEYLGNGKTGLLMSTVGCNVIGFKDTFLGKIIIVFIGAKSIQDRLNGVKEIVSFVENNYRLYKLGDFDNTQVRVRNGISKSINIKCPTNYFLLQKNKKEKLLFTIDRPEFVDAPVRKGQEIATLTIRCGNNQVRYPMISCSDVHKASGFPGRIFAFIRNIFI